MLSFFLANIHTRFPRRSERFLPSHKVLNQKFSFCSFDHKVHPGHIFFDIIA